MSEVEENYFEDPAKREMIFERDQWICQYCGEKVNENNLTLDHYIPVSKNGKNTADNLKTCCLVCNSLKSGKTFEEAAPLILNRLQERRSKVGL
jgi:5-methylcytosine-specific restriction endonuclease McrA